MNQALPAAMVCGYEHHLSLINLPDPTDRHVVAAGIAAKASIIFTWNLRHFLSKELKKFVLQRETPEVLLSRIYDEVPDLMIGTLANACRNLSRARIS